MIDVVGIQVIDARTKLGIPGASVKIYDQAVPAPKDVDTRVTDGNGLIPGWHRSITQGSWECQAPRYDFLADYLHEGRVYDPLVIELFRR